MAATKNRSLQSRYNTYRYDSTRRKDRGNAGKDQTLADSKYEYTLTLEQYTEIVVQNCYYCGCTPNKKAKDTDNNRILWIHGIDRRDNQYGYTKENSVSCCSRCNFSKSTQAEQQFIDQSISIALNTLKKGGADDQTIAIISAIMAKAKEQATTQQ